MTPQREDERRQQLRSLLFNCRSRLQPQDVGLPRTTRRRVSGLRREEVAELANVSSDWYRSFECGRVARVSVQFLARLANALRLAPAEKRMLFNLAIPELYEIAIVERRLTRAADAARYQRLLARRFREFAAPRRQCAQANPSYQESSQR